MLVSGHHSENVFLFSVSQTIMFSLNVDTSIVYIQRFEVDVSSSRCRLLGFEPQCTIGSLVGMSERGHCSTL